jgi:hypothetical protein
MTLLYAAITLPFVVGGGVVVARRAGWRAGLGAALGGLLLIAGVYIVMVMLIVTSMK